MRRRGLVVVMTGLLVGGTGVNADNVTDAIAEAQAAYQAGRIGGSQAALQRALQRLAEQAAAIHADALPAPLPGWRPEEASISGRAGPGGLRARTTVARRYINARGQHVTVGIVTGASMLNEVDRMLGGLTTGNPARDQRMQWVQVGREFASQSYDGTLRMFVGGHIIVVVDGNASADAIRADAEAVDLGRLTLPGSGGGRVAPSRSLRPRPCAGRPSR